MTVDANSKLETLNRKSASEAAEDLKRCCGSRVWVEKMLSQRPFQSVDDILRVSLKITLLDIVLLSSSSRRTTILSSRGVKVCALSSPRVSALLGCEWIQAGFNFEGLLALTAHDLLTRRKRTAAKM